MAGREPGSTGFGGKYKAYVTFGEDIDGVGGKADMRVAW
jgi:hypothetical protein